MLMSPTFMIPLKKKSRSTSCLKTATNSLYLEGLLCPVLMMNLIWFSSPSWWSALGNWFSSISKATSLWAWTLTSILSEPTDVQRLPYPLLFTKSSRTRIISTATSECSLLTSAQHSIQFRPRSWLENVTVWAWVQYYATWYWTSSQAPHGCVLSPLTF